LQIDRLERIVVDASHIDQKKRGILDMKEAQVPLVVWLGQNEFRERYAAKSGRVQLLFY
jgi:protein CMS1